MIPAGGPVEATFDRDGGGSLVDIGGRTRPWLAGLLTWKTTYVDQLDLKIVVLPWLEP